MSSKNDKGASDIDPESTGVVPSSIFSQICLQATELALPNGYLSGKNFFHRSPHLYAYVCRYV